MVGGMVWGGWGEGVGCCEGYGEWSIYICRCVWGVCPSQDSAPKGAVEAPPFLASSP